MTNYVHYIILHTRIRIFISLSCVHILQHINNNIDVIKIQIKGLIFSRPPAMHDVWFMVGWAITQFTSAGI